MVESPFRSDRGIVFEESPSRQPIPTVAAPQIEAVSETVYGEENSSHRG